MGFLTQTAIKSQPLWESSSQKPSPVAFRSSWHPRCESNNPNCKSPPPRWSETSQLSFRKSGQKTMESWCNCATCGWLVFWGLGWVSSVCVSFLFFLGNMGGCDMSFIPKVQKKKTTERLTQTKPKDTINTSPQIAKMENLGGDINSSQVL